MRSVSAGTQRRKLLGIGGIAGLGVVFVLMALFEQPGLGLGHLFYLPIVLLALAVGPRVGAAGGVLAAILYAIVVVFLRPDTVQGAVNEAMLIRLATFTAIGAVVGWFASAKRGLVAELQLLAERDTLTGLPNTRAFESAISRRLDAREPFVLLVGDLDDLAQINKEQGLREGDETLRRLAEVLGRTLEPEDDIARVGSDEFAVLTARNDDPVRVAARLEAQLLDEGCAITFGWARFPREGENALSLYRGANERLYVRKLARGLHGTSEDPGARTLRVVDGTSPTQI